jgi:Thioredoxin-like domain
MRPMYLGAMPNIRLNLFNVVLVLDLSDRVEKEVAQEEMGLSHS